MGHENVYSISKKSQFKCLCDFLYLCLCAWKYYGEIVFKIVPAENTED